MAEPWDPEICPFNRNCTGWLGRKRPTMLTNALLIRDTVGKPLTRGSKLPPLNHTYGMVLTDRTRTVQDALQGWGLMNIPDDHFTANKEQLKKAQHRKKDYFIDNDEVERPPTPMLNHNQDYGVINKVYSETMDEILTNAFQKQFLKETKAGNKCYMEAARAKEIKEKEQFKPGYSYENRACLLRKSAQFDKVEPSEPWRMRKFLDVEPHLSTFRSPGALVRARKADNFERVGRDGIWGHGIATKAKSLC